jgi:hypothetical protein
MKSPLNRKVQIALGPAVLVARHGRDFPPACLRLFASVVSGA